MNTQVPDRLRFKYGDFLWDGHKSPITTRNGRNVVTVEGPLCMNCKVKLSINRFARKANCIICKKSFEFVDFHEDEKLREEAKSYLEAKYDQDIPIVSFDLTPTKVIDEDNQDENYWLQAKVIQQDGKKLIVVYLGEKIHGKQNKKDYVQLFVDVEDEQLRFDKGNKNPMNILAYIKAEFKNSTSEFKKKDIK